MREPRARNTAQQKTITVFLYSTSTRIITSTYWFMLMSVILILKFYL